MSKRKCPEESSDSNAAASASGSARNGDDTPTHTDKKSKPTTVCIVEQIDLRIPHGSEIRYTQFNRICELPNGNILVAEATGLVALDTDTKVMTSIAKLDIALRKFTATVNQLIMAATCDSEGRIFFACRRSVYRIDPETNEVQFLAGDPNNATTPIAFVDGSGSQARFSGIYDMVYRSGELYVSDQGNCAIRCVNCSSGNVTTVICRNKPFDIHPLLHESLIFQATDMTIDPHGHLLFTDIQTADVNNSALSYNDFGRFEVCKIDVDRKTMLRFPSRDIEEYCRIHQQLPPIDNTNKLTRVYGCDAVGNVFITVTGLVTCDILLVNYETMKIHPIASNWLVSGLVFTKSGDLFSIDHSKCRIHRIDGLRGVVSRRDQRLAFACGLHVRLGAESAIRVCSHVDRRLLRFVLDHL